MKNITKYLTISALAVSSIGFVGCGKKNNTDSNKELAKRIETESTELIYSIESTDDIKISDLAENAVKASASYTLSSFAVNTTGTTNNNMTNSSEIKSIEKSTTTSNKLVELSTNDLGDLDQYSKELVEKRSEVMLLCSKLRKGDIKLSEDELRRVNECINLVNSTSSYLEANKGTMESDFQKANTTASKVALREKLAIRQAKLQTGILAMDEIISIMNGNKQQIKVDSTTKSSKPTANNALTISNQNKTAAIKSTETKTNSIGAQKKNDVILPSATSESKTSNITTDNSRTNLSKDKTRSSETVNRTAKNSNSKTSTQTLPSSSKNESNDAVSILVQPLKTENSKTTIPNNQNVNQTTNNEYIVRPRQVSMDNSRRNLIAMPQTLPKSTIMPYQSN